MNRDWPWEAVRFSDSVRATLERLGGVDFVRAAEVDPRLRSTKLASELKRLGWPELDVHASADDALVVAAAARVAGGMVAPWPMAGELAVPVAMRNEADALYLIADDAKRLEHLDLFDRPVAVDLRTGKLFRVTASGGVTHMPLDPFGVAAEFKLEPEELGGSDLWRRAVDAHIIISAFYVLGALERAVVLATQYANERHQFGQPIAQFGAIQWRLADLALAQYGLAELAQFTLWRFCERIASPSDTLALRLAMVEAADVVLVNSHQVLGAIGLTEAHDLTVMDRHLQPLLRRPSGAAATSALLRDAIKVHGFDGLFPIEGSEPLVSPFGRARSRQTPSRADGEPES